MKTIALRPLVLFAGSVGSLVLMNATNSFAANSYAAHNLVSDLRNLADHQDPNLTNPWGIAFSPSGPFWLGNNGSKTSTLYDGSGNINALVVTIPSPSDPKAGAVMGVIFNSAPAFPVAAGKNAQFIFCTEDGAITGWNSTANANAALIMIDRSSSGAVYKGCDIGGTAAVPLLYAANFNSGAIDVWDANLAPFKTAGAFADPMVATGFAPFNIQNIGGRLYVTYAKQDSQKHDDVADAGNGFVSIFDMQGNLLQHFISNGPLNSPWGITVAPANFGDFANDILIGNFGDGVINVFDPKSGAFIGMLKTPSNGPLKTVGLWALKFGNGGRGGDANTLYFTAGISGPNGEPIETHGLFGAIQYVPSFLTTQILNSASATGDLAPNAFVTIFGSSLSATTRGWGAADFFKNALPTQLDGVGVTFNGSPAYVNFVSPGQINALTPPDLAPGPAQVQITANGLASAMATVTIKVAAPGLFQFPSSKYAVATHANNSLIGPAGLLTGATTTPAAPGETIVLYGNGLGATNPAIPKGQLVQTSLPLAAIPTVTIGGQPATVSFSGLIQAGLYQLNVVVPSSVPAGDAPVIVTANGVVSALGVFVPVSAPAVTPTTVSIANFTFVPTPVNLTLGSALTWTNTDSATHTVVSDDGKFTSQNLPTNATFSVTPTAAGTYNYHCSIHPFMKGAVVVK